MAFQEFVDILLIHFQELRCGEFLPRLLLQRLGVIAEQLAQSAVHLLEPAARIQQAHTDGCVVHRPAVAFVGFRLLTARLLGFVYRRLLEGVDRPEGCRHPVLAAVEIVVGLGVHMHPFGDAVRTGNPNPLFDGAAADQSLHFFRVGRPVFEGNDLQWVATDPVRGRCPEHTFDRPGDQGEPALPDVTDHIPDVLGEQAVVARRGRDAFLGVEACRDGFVRRGDVAEQPDASAERFLADRVGGHPNTAGFLREAPGEIETR